MSKDPIEGRFRKKEQQHKLEDLGRRTMSTEEVEAEKEAIKKAKEERVKDPEKYQLKPGQQVGRNDPCPCGSGKKFKKCCGAE